MFYVYKSLYIQNIISLNFAFKFLGFFIDLVIYWSKVYEGGSLYVLSLLVQ